MPFPTDCPEARESNDRHGPLRTRRRRHLRRRREDESGLTTLEWLLIVAAVAGLAALAVVLVTNVVDSTSEQISGSSARLTAARVAAQEIVDQASVAAQDGVSDTWVEWETFYTRKCNRLEITYGDAGVDVTPRFLRWGAASGAGDGDAVVAIADATLRGIDTPASLRAATATSGVAQCGIG